MPSDQIGLRRKLRFVFESFEWRSFGMRAGRCPICGPTLFVRLMADQLGTRCVRCGGSPIALAAVTVIRSRVPRLAEAAVYEASSRGPVHAFLARHAAHLTDSEYFEDVRPGDSRDGVTCQDLQALTHADACFDLCTSTEVFEHVPDDARGFRELHRVLRPGGLLVFTVPLSAAAQSVERATPEPGGVRHILPATYHDDLIRGPGSALVYRDYGRDVTDRLRAAGFVQAEIIDGIDACGLGHPAPVILARKGAAATDA